MSVVQAQVQQVQVVEHVQVHVIELRLVIPGLSGQGLSGVAGVAGLAGVANHQPPMRFKVFQDVPDLPDVSGGADVVEPVVDERPEPTADSAESPLVPVSKATEPTEPIEEQRTLVELYQELLSERDKERRVSVKTIRDNKSVLNRFQQWAEKSDCFAGISPPIRLLEAKGILRGFAEYIRNQPKGHSAAMANKAIGVVIKLSNACQAAGIVSRPMERVPKSSVNLMKPRTDQQRRIKGVPVTIEELRAMLNVLDDCNWPRLGKVKPSVFWRANLLGHYLYGFRSQDWIACRGSEKKGLLWKDIIRKTECPVIKGLHNDGGWAFYVVHKTEKKDEAADRNSDVVIPLSIEMRDLIEQFRGIDDERVFPMANNSRTYSEEFSRILNRAGLSDESRIANGEPIIRPSLGQRGVASFRKGCATYWSELVGPQAASYLLHHYVPAEGVARMTTENYLQHEGILRKIVGKIEELSGLVS